MSFASPDATTLPPRSCLRTWTLPGLAISSTTRQAASPAVTNEERSLAALRKAQWALKVARGRRDGNITRRQRAVYFAMADVLGAAPKNDPRPTPEARDLQARTISQTRNAVDGFAHGERARDAADYWNSETQGHRDGGADRGVTGAPLNVGVGTTLHRERQGKEGSQCERLHAHNMARA